MPVSAQEHGSSELPVVSVVIPAFNVEEYIGAALDSVLAQTLQNLEVIVVDDASSDGTAAVAQSYAARDPRVRVHQRATPSGKPAVARNDGIKLARGEMIALLDADDIATPTRFDEEVSAMRKTGAGVAFADFRKFEHTDALATPMPGFLQQSDFVARAASHLQRLDVRNVYLCRPNFIEFMLADAIAVNVQTVMFRRDLITAPEPWFDDSFLGGEDVDLFYRLARRTSFVYINAVHALMRVHERSLTAVFQEQCLIDAAEVRRLNLGRLQPLLDERQVLRARASIAEKFLAVGYSQWRNGNPAAARSAFTTAWNVYPSLNAVISYAKAFLPRRLLVSPLRGAL